MQAIRFTLLIFMLSLAACGRGDIVQPTTPTVFIPPRSATATIEAQQATVDAAANPQTDTQTVAGDPVRGQELFTAFQPAANFACATCHLVDSEAQLIGPGLLNVSARAETRVPGQSVEEYLRNSILHPSEFVVPNFPDMLMPQVYGTVFTEDQINDLIAYLMTL
jgi:cytochrome c2